MAKLVISKYVWLTGNDTPLTSTEPALLELYIYDGATIAKQVLVNSQSIVVIRDRDHLEIYTNSKLLYKYTLGDSYGAGTVAASATEMYNYIYGNYVAES